MVGKKKSSDRQSEPNPEFDNFQRLLKNTLAVPKEELNKRRDEYERKQEQEKRAG